MKEVLNRTVGVDGDLYEAGTPLSELPEHCQLSVRLSGWTNHTATPADELSDEPSDESSDESPGDKPAAPKPTTKGRQNRR